MKFFNVDYHVTVIEDLSRIFQRLGHEIVSHNCTGHAWVFGRKSAPPFGGVTNENYWTKDPEQFRREHPELEQYDGFVFCYPPGFAELFQAFGKPIIMMMPIRYEYAYVRNPERWKQFNAWIQQATIAKQLWPVANSRFDVEYLRYFTGVEARHIPSMCDFYGLHHVAAGPKQPPLLWDARSEAVANHVLANVPSVQYLRRRYPRYEIATILQHRALVHVPYNASIMSLFEHYAMDIPLFVPTPDHLLHLKRHYNALSELSFYQFPPAHTSGSMIPGVLPGVPDPNAFMDEAALKHWMPYYDCYNQAELPHIQQFSCMEELHEQLARPTFVDLSAGMRGTNEIRRHRITAQWENLLEAIRCRS